MSEANKHLIRRWFEEVWNQGREATIDELFSADGIAHGLGDTEADVRGPEQFKLFVRILRGSFADLHISVEDVIAENDTVVARVRLEGTHTGDGLGLAPTGNRVRVAGIAVVRFANGQAVEAWNVWDQLGLLRQIGGVPGPEGRDRFVTSRS